MKLRNVFIFGSFILFFINAKAQQHFPGGVPGAEAWYIANYDDLDLGLYPNQAMQHITITSCPGNTFEESLFNFNHAISATNLCLQYNAPLENTTSRNIFFVGRKNSTGPDKLAHVITGWSPNLSMPATTPLWNSFKLALKNAYINKSLLEYSENNNANISFYNWNIYQNDRKFKSYGYVGETTFSIGKGFTIEGSPEITNIDFSGDFPEYIAYPFELTANQRNRVQSYLALKYGLTLADTELSYKNSKNVVFWDHANNAHFANRIFGIGRDDISGLNQLESQSTHNTDYLITSVGELLETNLEKQGLTTIDNNHFIVFGDNGGMTSLGSVNDFNVRPLQRKWLSQNTGQNSDTFDMYFKLNITGTIQDELTENPELKLWMLHDKYVTNDQESNFNSQYVEYYDPVMVVDDVDHAYFKTVNFDPDTNIYDQFTFGVGPELIVQLRLEADCDAEHPKANVVVTGGVPEYRIHVSSVDGFDQFLVSNSGEPVSFDALYMPDTYTVHVIDSEGNEAETEVDLVHYNLTVDLGPNITFSSSLQTTVLDAGAAITDPDATYKWYRNNILLAGHSSTFTVTEPGEYKVEITSGNHSCIVEDTVIVSYNFTGTVESQDPCNDNDGSIIVNLSGGIAPFTTMITKTGYTISQVHNTETFLFSNLEFGQYTITTIDNNGEVFTGSILLESPLGNGNEMSVISQLQAVCEEGSPNYGGYGFGCYIPDLQLDASANISNPNISYEWFMNDSSMNIYSPVVDVVQPNMPDPEAIYLPGGATKFTVKVTNLDTGCYLTETFYLVKFITIVEGVPDPDPELPNTRIAQNTENESGSNLIAKVYPNPTESGRTFYYEVSSSQVLQGTVEVFSASGAILHQETISGESSYTLPLSLTTAGVYFIRTTTTEGKVLTDKVIIR